MMPNTIMIVHDDAAIAGAMGDLLGRNGFSPLLIDDSKVVRVTMHQERPAAVILVQQHSHSTVIWDALQILWLDRAMGHTPIVLCLNDLDDLSYLMARLQRNCSVVLPLPTPDKMLVAALSAVMWPASVSYPHLSEASGS